METLGERLARATKQLEPVTETPRLDAEILLCHALGMTRAHVLASMRDVVDTAAFEPLLERRLAYEPIAYILGEWEFFSLSFKTTPPHFVPRPETEHLVEAMIDFAQERPGQPLRALDLCTGTGCVAVSSARNIRQLHVLAIDINPTAVALAAENAARLGVSARVATRQGDLFDALPDDERGVVYDAILSNPPYVEDAAWPTLSPVIRLHEDPRALLSEADGLGVVRRIVAQAGVFLKPGGLLAMEIGLGQYETVRTLLMEQGFERIAARKDLAGIDRIAEARMPEMKEG